MALGRETAGDNKELDKLALKDVSIKNNRTIYQITKFREALITCDDGTKLKFGTIAIMESMAYLLEQTCTDYLQSPDYPYNSAKKVAELFVPAIANDSVSLIALCDMALLCSNPGPIFVTFLQIVRDGKINVTKPEDIVDWFYNERYTSIIEDKEVTLVDNFKVLHNIAFSSLKDYVKGMALGNDINHYFHNLAESTLHLREKDKYFMINLARGGACLQNKTFLQLISNIGIPLLKNLKDEYYLFNNALGNVEILQYFSAIAEISKLFLNGQDSCSMKKWCKNSPESTPDFNCDIAPWKKVSDEKLCPYAFFWRHWNLEEYTPIVKHSLDES